MLEIKQIRNFLVLAEHLHFGKAAEAVNLTQPSLSRQLACIEDELGCCLVSRTSRSVELTAAGKEFQRLASGLMVAWQDAVSSTQAVARGLQGELKVGFTSYTAWTILPSISKNFVEQYPSVSMHLQEMLPMELISKLGAGEIDVGVTFQSFEEGLEYRHLHSEPLCIALPTSHALNKHQALTIACLEGTRFIISRRDTSPPLYDSIMQVCNNAGFNPKEFMHADLQQSIINLVAEGLGVAIVPNSMSKFNHDGVSYWPIDQSPQVECGVCWNPSNDNPCLENFLNLYPDIRDLPISDED